MKSNYKLRRDKTANVIVITSYIALICFWLMDIQWITNWNYTFHELLGIPFMVAFYVLPIEILVWIYYLIRARNSKVDEKRSIRNLLKSLLKIFSVVVIVGYICIRFFDISTSGLVEIESKRNEDNLYIIEVNDMDIKCTWNEYNLIEEGKVYSVIYVWNKIFPEYGKLEFIEPTDILFNE